MAEGKRLFDPPTLGDLVWAAHELGCAKRMLTEGPATGDSARLEVAAKLGVVVELLEAIAARCGMVAPDRWRKL